MNAAKKILLIWLAAVSAYYLYLCAPYFAGHFNFSRDFSIFYMAPAVLRHAAWGDLYNLQTQRQFFPQAPDVFMAYNHPPFEAVFFLPLSFLPFAGAFAAWNLCNAVFLVVIAKKLSAVYGNMKKISVLYFPRALLFVTAFFPVWFTLLNGQDSILFLLIFAASLHGAYSNRLFRSGLLMGTAVFKPHLCLPLAAGMGARWKRPFLLGFFLSAGFWTLLSFVLIGRSGAARAVSLLGLLSAEHAAFGIHYSQMANLRGALERFFPSLSFHSLAILSAAAWAAGVAFIIYRNVRASQTPSRRVYAREDLLMCALTVLISYHANGPDLVLLLIPVIVLFKYGIEERNYNEVSWGVGKAGKSGLCKRIGFVASAVMLFFFLTPLGMASYFPCPDLIVAFEFGFILLCGEICGKPGMAQVFAFGDVAGD